MENEFTFHIPQRPRRRRQNSAVRALFQETWLRREDFVQPLFIVDDDHAQEPVASMPRVNRLGKEPLYAMCESLLKCGVRAVALFPKLSDSLKTAKGDEALREDTLILRTIRDIKQRFPELILIADIALDPYTTHGHDGVLNQEGTDVDNDRTLAILVKMALLHAQAGVDWVAPSDMMDGRVGALRTGLDSAGFTQTTILAYTAKYASAYYGPFRDAVGSQQKMPISKTTYQMNPANRREARIEAELDIAEGADAIMVKPAGAYLDIIRDLRETTNVPIAAYQVSGEYAQIHAAAERGWLDYTAVRNESLLSIKRAGADFILTYFAKEVAEELGK